MPTLKLDELELDDETLELIATCNADVPSRVQLNRLLDPKNDGVTLATLSHVAAIVGRRLRLELV